MTGKPRTGKPREGVCSECGEKVPLVRRPDTWIVGFHKGNRGGMFRCRIPTEGAVMSLRPVPMTIDELAALLRDMLAEIERKASFGGSIEYDALDPDVPPDKHYMVRGVYRVGNDFGQGGTRMIGTESGEGT